MNKTLFPLAGFMAALLLILTLSAAGLDSETPAGDLLVGIWQGTVTGKPGTVQIFFSIENKAGGGYMAKIDIPAQTVRSIPVSEIRWTPPDLVLDMSSFGVMFQGRMEADGSHINGLFKIGGEDLALVLSRAAAVPEQRRPQDPRKPYPYDEIEVLFRNPEASIDLAGTLTVPRGEGPFPAVVLVTGSGPQDRDESIAGHKPFLVLADALTRRGIAVLRYDDRGCGQSGGDFHKATTVDFAGDARAAWRFLRRQPRVDGRRVGLAGHSEGALVGPMVASRNGEVAFLVLMAAPGISGMRVAVTQQEAMMLGRGVGEEAARKAAHVYEQLFQIIQDQEDPQLAEEAMKRIVFEALAGLSDAEKKEARLTENSLLEDMKESMADYPWFRFFLGYDPATALRQVQCPVLVLNGDKDTQVLADLNLPPVERALKEAGNSRYEIKRLPGLNHLFQTAKTGDIREYRKIEETISPAILQLVGDWILDQTRLSK